jgi:3-methylcrotonyl-CoA carboxylase alpha subunit
MKRNSPLLHRNNRYLFYKLEKPYFFSKITNMFTKILIANRGEIACRIIETARLMGIGTVAVYSDADRKARHVRMADEAIHIGSAAASDSYLKGDVIIQAALDSGVQAIHPGYGFLSENAEFASACAKAGIKFIGPDAASIIAMGLKDKAKELMAEAGVPVVPGYQGEEQSPDFLQKQADDIGYPLLIKAVAGGGGKGMRLVEKSGDFKDLLQSCQREAKSAFSNDHVLLEKYITKPRHVEVQVFGDSHGGAVHLFERDCSLQRRHQKVVEEAPAPGLPEEVRSALGEAAVKAVQALKYENAGTIEFIMDSQSFDFYFMEMNTRLQVEHPVTEMITGLDLVEWQLRVAAGDKLPLTQDQIKMTGHAFEVRLYAEDPANEFLPQTGKIKQFTKHRHARIDTGVDAGDEVTIHYDPMIAKIIIHSRTRDDAINQMQRSLRKTAITGLNSNQEFLYNIFVQEDFIAGNVDTGFIPAHEATLIPSHYGQPGTEELALAACHFLHSRSESKKAPQDPWAISDNWRGGAALTKTLRLTHKGGSTDIIATCEGDTITLKTDAEKAVHCKIKGYRKNKLDIIMDNQDVRGTILQDGHNLTILRNGRLINIHLFKAGEDSSDEQGHGRIITPMPGKIIDVMVKKGDNVNKDQPLIIMEAMKMEMTIRAGCAGIVEDLPVAAGDQVADGSLLVSIEGEEQAA